MISSQLKKVEINENSRLERIDVVRSLRKQGLPAPVLQPHSPDQIKPLNYHTPVEGKRSLIEKLLIGLIVLTLCLLLADLTGVVKISGSKEQKAEAVRVLNQYRSGVREKYECDKQGGLCRQDNLGGEQAVRPKSGMSFWRCSHLPSSALPGRQQSIASFLIMSLRTCEAGIDCYRICYNYQMNAEESPHSLQSREASSEATLLSCEGSEQSSRMRWEPQQLNVDPIDVRLSSILSRAFDYLTHSSADPLAAVSELTLLGEKINFLRSNKRKFDAKLEALCHYDIACAYQIIAFKRAELSAIEDCIKHVELAIQTCSAIRCNEASQQWFQLGILEVRMSLQYCALLSQLNKHEEALEISKKCVEIMIEIFERGLKSCIQMGKELEKEPQNAVSFASKVVEKAKEYLLELAQCESYETALTREHEEFRKIKESNYFWKDNFENNEKTMRKGLHLETRDGDTTRNILGLRVSSDWVSEYTIGQIMHMRPFRYEDFLGVDNVVMEFSYRNIIEKVILTSVAYFSIATEMRFIEGSSRIAPASEMKKSEVFHLKAIETVCKYIKGSSLYVDHLISSYHRHYHAELRCIVEEPSFAEQSVISIGQKKPPPLPIWNEYQDSGDSVLIFQKKKNRDQGVVELGGRESQSPLQKSHELWSKERRRKKLQQKLEKSSSITNYQSMKAEKKSFSRVKDSTLRNNKSPELSCKLKPKGLKSAKKSSRLLTKR